MAWKTLGLSAAEFMGGLATLKFAMPLDSLMLMTAGLGLTLVGLTGLARLSKPKPRPYESTYE